MDFKVPARTGLLAWFHPSGRLPALSGSGRVKSMMPALTAISLRPLHSTWECPGISPVFPDGARSAACFHASCAENSVRLLYIREAGRASGNWGCCTAPSSDTLNAYRPILRILLKIEDFPGAKSAGNEFSLSVGKRTFAKILLVPQSRYCGSNMEGLRPLHTTPSNFEFGQIVLHII